MTSMSDSDSDSESGASFEGYPLERKPASHNLLAGRSATKKKSTTAAGEAEKKHKGKHTDHVGGIRKHKSDSDMSHTIEKSLKKKKMNSSTYKSFSATLQKQMEQGSDSSDSDSEEESDSSPINIFSKNSPHVAGQESESESVSEDSEEEMEDDGQSGDGTTNMDSQMAALRKELSEMPFEDLQKLKEKIGTKMYNKAMSHGKETAAERRMRFKRENKNRPSEMSSKRTVSRRRDVIPTKKRMVRDPRFDDLSGDFSEKYFNSNYSFLGDIKQREKEKLQKKLKKESDPEKKKTMEQLLQRIGQKEKSEKDKQLRLQQEVEWRKKERELVKEGKTPFFLKKSDKKKLELAEKFRELKKSGKIEKYLNKKRKKNASKDRRKLPNSHKQF